MRDHATIVRAIGAASLHKLLAAEGFAVGSSTPQRWADRDNIPSEYWATLVRLDLATFDELASAAETKKSKADVGVMGSAYTADHSAAGIGKTEEVSNGAGAV